MTLKKDKQKVLGERFDNARIRSFLQYLPPDGIDADFHVLEKAYRGMVAEDFVIFLTAFLDAGRNLNATNPQGQTITDIVRQHRRGDDYLDALMQAGAT